MVLLIIPAIFLFVAWSLFWAAIVLEEVGPVEALKRSFRLVRGNWWRTLTVLSIPTVLLLVVYMGVGLVIGFTVALTVPSLLTQGAAVDPITINMVAQIIQIPFNAAFAPLPIAMMLVLFHDLKLRKEGSDLEQRLAAS